MDSKKLPDIQCRGVDSSLRDGILHQPSRPGGVVLGVDVNAVERFLLLKIAVAVVEQRVCVEVEGTAVVGEGRDHGVEGIDSGVVDGVSFGGRSHTQVRHEVDNGVGLVDLDSFDDAAVAGEDVLRVVADLIDTEHDIHLAVGIF